MSPWDDPRIRNGMRTQLEKRRARIAAGETPIGWKVGFGAPPAMEKLGLSAPLVGFLMQKALLPSPATASLRGWQKPAAEAEIAVYLGADLPAGGSREAARSAIAAIGPAIELADIDGPADDVESILAGDIFQRHVVLGPRDHSRAGIKLEGLRGGVMRSGQAVAVPANLETNIGNIATIVRHVADTLGAFGETMRTGDVLITGSLTAPLLLEQHDTEVSFTLAPVGGVSVRFS
jgi:2-keto-4-pentenoate hydratase